MLSSKKLRTRLLTSQKTCLKWQKSRKNRKFSFCEIGVYVGVCFLVKKRVNWNRCFWKWLWKILVLSRVHVIYCIKSFSFYFCTKNILLKQCTFHHCNIFKSLTQIISNTNECTLLKHNAHNYMKLYSRILIFQPFVLNWILLKLICSW